MNRAIEKIETGSPFKQTRLSQEDYHNKKSIAGKMPKHILVVDDDNQILVVLVQFLKEMDFDVEGVKNGYEAMELLIRESYDLVITDLQMPGMNGWELAFNIKKKSPGTPVVLITGAGSSINEGEEKIYRQYVDSILFKTFKLKKLLGVVYTLLGRE